MSDNMPTTELEKTSLEAHVDLCAMRYKQLDTRLTVLEHKVDAVNDAISKANTALRTTIVTTAGTIVASIVGVIVTILMKF